MPTTSGSVVSAAVAGLARSGLDFALLTPLSSVPEGPSSDVDLVVGDPPGEVVARALDSWAESGLSPIMIWAYDASGSASVFIASSDASQGVQLDLLHDPSGRHGYRVNSKNLLGRATEIDGYPHVDEAGRLAYLWQKRRSKGQGAAVKRVLDQARALSEIEVRDAEQSITGDTGFAEAAFHFSEIPEFRTRRGMADLRRYARRAIEPVGFWAHTELPNLAEGLRDRFARLVVSARSAHSPTGILNRRIWIATRVWPEIVRPHAFFSWGRTDFQGSRLAVGVSGSIDQASEELVAVLAERVRRCVS